MTELERATIKSEIEEEVRAQIREANRLYKKEWRRRNPDKVKAATERYWLKKAREMMERGHGGEV